MGYHPRVDVVLRNKIGCYVHLRPIAPRLSGRCVASLVGPDIIGSSVYRIRPKLPGFAGGEVPFHQVRVRPLTHHAARRIKTVLSRCPASRAAGCPSTGSGRRVHGMVWGVRRFYWVVWGASRLAWPSVVAA